MADGVKAAKRLVNSAFKDNDRLLSIKLFLSQFSLERYTSVSFLRHFASCDMLC